MNIIIFKCFTRTKYIPQNNKNSQKIFEYNEQIEARQRSKIIINQEIYKLNEQIKIHQQLRNILNNEISLLKFNKHKLDINK